MKNQHLKVSFEIAITSPDYSESEKREMNKTISDFIAEQLLKKIDSLGSLYDARLREVTNIKVSKLK